MKALTVRNLDTRLARALKREAARRDTSLNQTVLDLLRQSLGVESGAVRSNGLRKLAGRWSARELAKFESDTAPFEQIDEELWA